MRSQPGNESLHFSRKYPSTNHRTSKVSISSKAKAKASQGCTHLQRRKLHVGIAALQPTLQRSHRIFRLNTFRPNNIRNLQVQGDILPACSVRHPPFKLPQPPSPPQPRQPETYNEDDVARSIRSSSGELDENQPDILTTTTPFN